MENDRIVELELMLLQPNPLQPRGLISPDSLTDLVNSIREQGILEPIVVAKTPAGFQIIAGERRWRASKILGLEKVPVIVKETTPLGMLEMSIVENIQREDLNPIERALAYKRLIEEFGLSVTEVAKRLGKSLPYISNSLRLLTLPDALKDALMSGATTEGHARAMSALEEPRLIIEAYKEVLKRNLSVRGTEEMVRRFRVKSGIAPRKSADISSMHIVSDEIDKVQSDLSDALSRKIEKSQVKCFQTGKKARIELMIEGDPGKTTKVLEDIREAIVGYFNLNS